jgi:hypothetical protein
MERLLTSTAETELLLIASNSHHEHSGTNRCFNIWSSPITPTCSLLPGVFFIGKKTCWPRRKDLRNSTAIPVMERGLLLSPQWFDQGSVSSN